MAADEHRGAGVDAVERFDHMVLLALRLSRDRRGIFKIELPLLHRLGALDGVGGMRQPRSNASMLAQESVNATCRARQAQSCLLEALITRQILQQGLGTRGPAEPEGSLVPHLQQAIHHERVQPRRPMVRRAGEAMQDLLSIGRSTRQALLPLARRGPATSLWLEPTGLVSSWDTPGASAANSLGPRSILLP